MPLRKFTAFVFLSLLPLILYFTSGLIKQAGGEYYLNYSDPSYEYLVNSLNIMQLAGAGHIDHPGTPLQYFGAVVLKIYFLNVNSETEILNEVFSNPEFFVVLINKSFVILNCVILFLSAFMFMKITGNIFFALLIQLSPFVSFETLYSLVIISPENFLTGLTLILSLLILIYVYKDQSLKLIIAFSIVCGTGCAAKLTFVPFCIIPFLLIRQLKNKILFLALALLTFFIIFLPAVTDYEYFIQWIKQLVFNSGIHGQTEKFSFAVFCNNVLEIFSKDPVFTIIYFVLLTGIAAGFFRKPDPESKIYFCHRLRLALIAILAGVTLQILITAKNYLGYVQYYIVPSIIISVFALAVYVLFIYQNKNALTGKLSINKAFIFLIILIAGYSIFEIQSMIKEASRFRDEAISIHKYVKNLSGNNLVIADLTTANEDCALIMTTINNYSGKNRDKYLLVINNLISSKIFYNPWKDSLFASSPEIDISKSLGESKKIIFQLSGSVPVEMIINLLKDYNIINPEYKLLFKNGNNEAVYEIKIKN